jgi:hypothetical protein
METETIIETKRQQINLFSDASVMNAFEKCPQLMKYQYIDNLRPKGIVNVGLEKGDLIHIPLKHYYSQKKAGVEWSDAIQFSVGKLLRYTPKLNLADKDIQDVMTSFMSYCEFYRFERWEVVEVERPFRLVIYEDSDLRVILQGRIDLLVDNGQMIMPVDHKSESRRSEPVELSNQFMAYAYASKSSNIIVNKIGFQTSLKAEEKFYRKMLSYEDDNLEEWRDEYIFKIRELIGYAEINHFPHRYSSCQDKYGKCSFHDICHTHRAAREMKLKSHFQIVEPWDPFLDKEEEDESKNTNE